MSYNINKSIYVNSLKRLIEIIKRLRWLTEIRAVILTLSILPKEYGRRDIKVVVIKHNCNKATVVTFNRPDMASTTDMQAKFIQPIRYRQCRNQSSFDTPKLEFGRFCLIDTNRGQPLIYYLLAFNYSSSVIFYKVFCDVNTFAFECQIVWSFLLELPRDWFAPGHLWTY